MKMTANQLLEFFVEIAPFFKELWNSDENLSIDDDGSFNFHAVCTQFSYYFMDQVSFKEPTLLEKRWNPDIPDSKLKILFDFIEENLTVDGYPEDELDNALCTCFLEHIAQTLAGQYAKNFMGDKSKSYFDYWNNL